ncbi:MAG: pentapeptide repeat-containing protein [Oligoflexales bacterium]|nr:pentapeptide repeat-containing protein [Oligoflexales bacterium]
MGINQTESEQALQKQDNEPLREEQENKQPDQTFTVSEPASIKSQEDLEKIIKEHRVWMESVLDPKTNTHAGRANFSGADLSGFDLSGQTLKCADFSEANLEKTIFSYSDLASCDFRNAKLSGTVFTGANLKRANFEGTDVSTAILKEADISNTCLDEDTN